MRKNNSKLKCLLLIIVLLLSSYVVCGCDKKQLDNNVYNISCEYVSSGVIGGAMRLDYVCDIKDGTDVLKFNLFANAFREQAEFTPIREKLEEYGKIDILKVSFKTEASETLLDYEINGSDKNILTVKLDSFLDYGDKTNVCIDFAVTLPSGKFRMSKGTSTINIGNFYPILCIYENGSFVECDYTAIGDPFYSSVSDYNVDFVVPSTYVVSASALASSCDVAGEKTKYSYCIENVRDFAFCISEKFELISEDVNGTTINYYYYNDKDSKTTFEAIKQCVSFFSEKFGDYPYECFSVAESDFNEGGMEYPCLVYVNCELESLDKIYTAVHETAHQWWYGMVGNNQIKEAFLDEGLTEYSTAVFFSENPQFNIDGDLIFKNAENSCNTYQKTIEALKKNVDLKMQKDLKEFDGEYHYVIIAYNRGMTMMKRAEEVCGRTKILSYMKAYFEKYRYKIADCDDFLAEMKGAKPILKEFIDGNVTA